MCAWSAPRTWTAGETITAAIMNTHVRDQLLETFVAKTTAAGDIAYASAANSLVRLALGSARAVLRASTGSTGLQYGPVTPLSSQFMGGILSNYHIEGGGATAPANNVTVSFARAFAAAPVVVATVNGTTATRAALIQSIATTGFVVQLSIGNDWYAGDFQWIALGSDT